MSIRSLTKVPKLCLLYFGIVKSTCIVPTKKLRMKGTGELFTQIMLERRAAVTLRNNGKLLDAMVIALDGKWPVSLLNAEFLFLSF